MKYTEQWWSDTDGSKTEDLGEKPDSVPLCPTEIPHELARDRTHVSAAISVCHRHGKP